MDLLIEPDGYEKRPLPEPEARLLEAAPLPAPEPRYHHPSETDRSQDGQAWLKALALVVVAAAAIFLLVLFARWVYHEVHDNNSNNSGQGSSSQNSPAKSNGQNAGSSSGGSHSSSSQSSSAGSSSASGSSSGAGQTGGSQLADTGPGNVAAVFIASSLAAAGLHYIISLRRFSKNRV